MLAACLLRHTGTPPQNYVDAARALQNGKLAADPYVEELIASQTAGAPSARNDDAAFSLNVRK
jgi:hypothetical protein